jgi:hypothetical protein
MTDCQGLAAFASAMATVMGSVADFVNAFSVLTPAASGESTFGVSWNSEPVFFGGAAGQTSGFSLQYQDGYGSTAGPNSSDQGHHFAGLFQFGYQNPTLSGIGAFGYEYYEGTTENQGDINLGNFAASLGAQLRAGTITPSGVASQIGTLCAK